MKNQHWAQDKAQFYFYYSELRVTYVVLPISIWSSQQSMWGWLGWEKPSSQVTINARALYRQPVSALTDHAGRVSGHEGTGPASAHSCSSHLVLLYAIAQSESGSCCTLEISSLQLPYSCGEGWPGPHLFKNVSVSLALSKEIPKSVGTFVCAKPVKSYTHTHTLVDIYQSLTVLY